MKVLLTADVVGGVWTYALTLARALERHDVQVCLATMGGALSRDQRADVRRCKRMTVHESTFRLEWMRDPWHDVAAAGEWLLGLEQQLAPDVVHLNGYVHAQLPWSAPVVVVGHSCVLSWWQAVHGSRAPAEWNRYHAEVSAGLAAADVVVAPTHAMLGALNEHYGPVSSGRVIPNGSDASRLPPGARDGCGWDAGRSDLHEPLVLCAGRAWDESKNFATLSAAAPLIHWPVYHAGSNLGPSGEAQPLDGVHCLGTLSSSALASWYRRASIFAHPAVYEPFGLAPLEAALSQCALVLGDVPSLREVWGDAALYVPPRDAGAVAAAVNELVTQPLRLAAMAEAARRRASTYTARHMAGAYHALYVALSAGAGSAQEVTACAS